MTPLQVTDIGIDTEKKRRDYGDEIPAIKSRALQSVGTLKELKANLIAIETAITDDINAAGGTFNAKDLAYVQNIIAQFNAAVATI